MMSWYSTSNCMSAEDLPDLVETAYERVDVRGRVVHVQRGAGHRGDPEALAHRAGAVVAHAYLNTEVVENLPDVVRVDAVERERQRAAPADRHPGAEDPQPGYGLERVERVRRELL